MNECEQIKHLAEEINSVIRRFRSEYSIMIASAVGVLHIIAHELIAEITDDDDDEQEFDEGYDYA